MRYKNGSVEKVRVAGLPMDPASLNGVRMGFGIGPGGRVRFQNDVLDVCRYRLEMRCTRQHFFSIIRLKSDGAHVPGLHGGITRQICRNPQSVDNQKRKLMLFI